MNDLHEYTNAGLLELFQEAISLLGEDDAEWFRFGYTIEDIQNEILKRMG